MANVRKTVEIDVLTKDADAKAKLDAISAKADKLREEHPELTVRIDTAEATAKMAVFREELKAATRPVTEEIKVKVNDRDLADSAAKLSLFGANYKFKELGEGNGGGGFLSTLTGGAFEGGLFSPGGITAMVAAFLPLLTELTGVVAGFTAAGLGVGAFAALAIPTFDKIKNAYTGISAAQATYHAAVQLEAKDPTTTNKTAVTTALAQLRIAYDNISPATRKAITGIDQFKNTYEKMAKAFEPNVLGVFDRALAIANELLPDLKPLADDAMKPIQSLLDHLGTFFKLRESVSDNSYLQKGGKLIDQTQLTGFGQFLQDIKQLEGPSIAAIGSGIGRVATNFGKLITSMSAKDVVHAINIAFDILSGTIRAMTWLVKESMTSWDKLSKRMENWYHNVRQWTEDAWHAVDHAFDNIKHAFDNVTHALGVMVTGTRALWDRAVTDIEHWYHDVVHWLDAAVTWFKELPGKIIHAIGDLGGMLLRAGENAIKGLLGGLQHAGGGVLSWVEGFASKIGSVFGAVLRMTSPSRVFEEHGKNIVRGLVLGMDGSSGLAVASSQRLARSVAGAGAYGSAAAGGTRVVLELSGSDQQILTAFAHALRVRGGSPALIGLKT